jgi:hypothetical protein
MLYCQRSTPSKTQEAEKMGKKTVLIADQNALKRKVSSVIEDVTAAWFVTDSFKIVPTKTGEKVLSGRNMYISGKR